jgi:YD repeat-containing protein
MSIGTNPSGGVLSGTTTKNASSGIASFNDLTIDKAANGYTLVAASTGLTSATSNTFSITAPDLVVTVISNPPATAAQGTSFSVTDTTANSGNASAAASTTNYRLSLDNVITTSDALLTGTRSVPSLAAATNSSGSVNVTIPAGLASGTYFLGACADGENTVAESNETNNCLASTGTIIVSGGATITSLLPASGPVGFSVTINGSSFGATQGTSTVTFNNTTASPSSWSATSIVAPVPAGATTGPVVVTVGGIASNSVTFTVTLAVAYSYDDLGRLKSVVDPTGDTAVYNYDAVGNLLSIDRHASSVVSVVEFQPKSGAVNTTVTIQGSGFSTTPNQNTVTFNGTAASVTAATIASLTVTVPLGATSGLINVTAPGGSAASSVPFTVTASSGPTITNFNPTIGTAGTSVAITGTNFDTTAANNNVRFNSALSGVSSSTVTTINTTVPTGTGSGKISVTTPRGSATSSADFFVPPVPFTATDVQFTGRLTVGGASLTVSITTANKIAVVAFDGSAGQTVNVQLSNVSFANCQSNVVVSKPNGSALYTKSCVPHAGTNFNVLLPDTGGYSLSVNAASGATGSMAVNISVTTPGPNPLILNCVGSCEIRCGDTNKSLTFVASGGKPPYQWSTNKGTITLSSSDRSQATLTPPTNTGGSPGQTAYQYYTWYQTGSGSNHYRDHPIGCDDVPIIACRSFLHNGCNPTTFDPAMGNCRNAPNPTQQIIATFCSPPNNVVPVDTSGNGSFDVNYGACDVGFFCDKRSDQMISGGCRPCSAEMQGVTVTVTDANNNSVPLTPVVK